MDETAGERRIDGTIEPQAAGERVDRALALSLVKAAPELTRSRIKSLIEAGKISLDGAKLSDPSRRVKPGQTFAIIVPEPRSTVIAAQEMPLSIVYEDEDLIVIDKPAGLVVHPAPGNPDRTLVNALIAHCGESLAGVGGERRPGIVHRLDKDTSGLMVVAKTDAALHGLARQFHDRTIDRLYQAVVHGVPTPPEGVIEGAIGRSRADRKRMAVVRAGGKPATTRYRVLRRLAGGSASLIECKLGTGRTHQIRVHLASRGHPLVGDPVYGRRRAGPTPGAGFPRQALDAVTLGFAHPRHGERLTFAKELASDIKYLLDSLE